MNIASVLESSPHTTHPLIAGTVLKEPSGSWKWRALYKGSAYESYGFYTRAAALADLREVLRGIEEMR